VFVPTHTASLVLLVVLCAAAAAFDLRSGLIPNRLLLVGLGLTLFVRVAVECFAEGLPLSAVLLTMLVGTFACALIPLVLYAGKGLGGGDLKLLALGGLSLGPWAGLELQVYAFAFGSLFAFGYLAYRGTLFRTLARSALMLVPALPTRARREPTAAPDPALSFRFGPAIFAAALFTAARHLGLAWAP
jgi:Flp pilus assembly protein protease CpaA